MTLTEDSMPFVAVMLEGIIMGFLYRKATTGPFCPAEAMQRFQTYAIFVMHEGRVFAQKLQQG